MSNSNWARQYVVDLYNSYNAVAERVDKQLLSKIHIDTQLDSAIRAWVSKGFDIVLTGNPGDGKTHLIEVLRQKGAIQSAVVVTDASQETSQKILINWAEARRHNQSFVLAINHAPLRALAIEAKLQPLLNDLTTIDSEIERFVFYNQPSDSLAPKLRVVDLSQRELLTETNGVRSVVRRIAETLSNLVSQEPCPHCPPRRCPVDYNARALANQQVLDRLITLFALVARRGIHVTMRDLTGMLAFTLTAGVPCQNRWEVRTKEDGETRTPTFDSYAYYNLLFDTTARSPLFTAMRELDVGSLGDPIADLPLWYGNFGSQWIFDNPVPPNNIGELRRLKRRYYFEYEMTLAQHTQHLNRMLPHTVYSFDKIVTGQIGERDSTERLIRLINYLFAPRPANQTSDYAHRLRLWNNHRYSRGDVPGHFAMRSLTADKLTVYHPSLAPQLEDAIEVKQDHVLLAVQNYQPGAPALRVDWQLYQALVSAEAGRPYSLQPNHVLRRLDLFLRSLGQDVGGPRTTEFIEWSSLGHEQRVPVVRVNRQERKYEDYDEF